MTSPAPASINWSTMVLPMKPAPPVTRQRVPVIRFISPPRWSATTSVLATGRCRNLCDNREGGVHFSTWADSVRQFDRLPIQFHGLLCSFEQANYTIARVAVTDRQALFRD